eukprot:1321705-Ditylum_brightwellii.AAC.2
MEHKSKVPAESKEFKDRFGCNAIGKVKGYVGYKIERNEEDRHFKFTQLVLLQNIEDGYDLTSKQLKCQQKQELH